MANFTIPVDDGAEVLYGQIRNQANEYCVVATPVFEAFDDTHWASYVLPLVNADATSATVATGTFPALDPGHYEIDVRINAGGTPSSTEAKTDFRLATWPVYWNGTGLTASVDGVSSKVDDIATAIVTGAPTANAAKAEDGGEVVAGDQGATSYTAAETNDDNWWEIAVGALGEGVGGGEAGVDVNLTFSLGETVKASTVAINGRWAGAGEYCDVFAWDYVNEHWDQLSNAATRMPNAANDSNFAYALLTRNQKAYDGGEVKIRFYSASTNAAHTLYLDKVNVTGVQLSVLTAGEIADQVWMVEERKLTDPAGGGDATLANQELILAKTNLIGSANITYSSWVGTASARRIFAGEDFLAVDGRALAFSINCYTGPDLADATCKLRLLAAQTYDAPGSAAAELEVDATVTIDGTTIVVAADVTAAQTAILGSVATGKTPNYVHQWVATLANGHKVMLLQGRLIVSESIE